MIPNSLSSNPYLNQSIQEIQRERRVSFGPKGGKGGEEPIRRLSNTVGSFYKQYEGTSSTMDEVLASQLQKLSSINGELQVRCSQLLTDVRILEEQNTDLRSHLGRYAQTLEKMYRLHNEQQGIIGKLRAHERETGDYSESLGQRNLQLNNQIQNLALDRQLLAYRRSEEDQRANRDKEVLGQRLTEKAEELLQLKRRYNGLLEVKAKLEEDLSGLKFSLDNVRQQAQLQLKEKSIKLDNAERSFQDTIIAKNEEIRHMNDRLRSAEEEIHKLRESNTLLLTRGDLSQAPRLDNVSRIYPNDSNIKSFPNKSASKENWQAYANIRYDAGRIDPRFEGGQQRQDAGRVDNRYDGGQHRQDLGRIDPKFGIGQQRSNAGGRIDPKYDDGQMFDGAKVDYKQDGGQQRQDTGRIDPKFGIGQQRLNAGRNDPKYGDGQQMLDGDRIDNRHDGGQHRQDAGRGEPKFDGGHYRMDGGRIGPNMEGWQQNMYDGRADGKYDGGQHRLVDLLSEKDRMLEEKDSEIIALQEKLRRVGDKAYEGSAENRKAGIFEAEKELQILNPMILTIETLRGGINKIVFEKFVISANHADQRKQNSLVLFITNMNEFVQKDGPQIRHSIQAYYQARNGIKEYMGKQILSPALREKLFVAIGKLTKYTNDFRDKVSKWVQGTLAYTIEQKRLDKAEKNKEIMFLFRLLTIKYRILYPIRGKSFTVDADLKAVLEHKVVSALKNYLLIKMQE